MLKPVYALVGSDPFLQLQELREIAALLPPDAQRIDYDGETVQLAEILDELQSFAMFGGGTKLVTVREADALITRYREQLEDYVNKPSSSATLVLRLSSLPSTQRIAKAIAKVGAIESCAPPKDLVRWAIDHAKHAHKITLMPDAAKVLVDYVGADLGRLDTELAKLAIQCDAGKISLDTVCANVAFTREREMWDLTNALGSRQRRRGAVALAAAASLRSVDRVPRRHVAGHLARRHRDDRQHRPALQRQPEAPLEVQGQFRSLRAERRISRQGRLRRGARLADRDRQAKQIRRRRCSGERRAIHPRDRPASGRSAMTRPIRG
jgi:hypothetical protein